MGKSFKKTSITGNAGSSDKEDKRKANRAFRRSNKVRIQSGLDPLEYEEVADDWTFSKDGRHYFDRDKHPDLMRK